MQFDSVGADSLDGDGLSVFLSEKNPTHIFYLTGHHEAQGTLWIDQGIYESSVPFKVTLRQDDEVIAVYALRSLSRSAGSRPSSILRSRNGEVEVELEMLERGPAWFHLRSELGFGMG